MARIKPISLTICFLFLAIGLAILLLNAAVNYTPIQQYFINKLNRTSGHTIGVERLNISFVGGFGVSGQNPKIQAKTGRYRFQASRVTAHLSFPELLRGRVQPIGIEIVSPAIELHFPQPQPVNEGLQPVEKQKRPATGGPVSGQGLSAEVLGTIAGIQTLTVKDARLLVVEKNIELQGVDATIRSRQGQTAILDVDVRGLVSDPERPIPFTTAGAVDLHGKTEERPFFQGVVEASGIPLPRLPRTRFFWFRSGDADATIQLKAVTRQNIRFEANVSANQPGFTIRGRREPDVYLFDEMRARVAAQLDGSVFQVISSSLATDAFELNTTARLDFSRSSDPELHVVTQAPAMELATFKDIFPVSLLPAWLENRIFPVFSDGKVQVREFSLHGTVNQIRELGRPENRDVLALRIAMEGMNAFEGDGGLPIGSVSGRLDIAGGRLSADNMKGRFGASVLNSGDLVFPDLYQWQKRFLIGLDGDFELADIQRQQKIQMVPGVVRKVLSAFDSMKGVLSGRVNLAFSAPKWLPEITDSHLISKGFSLAIPKWIYPVELKNAKITADSTGTPYFKGKGNWGATRFDLTAKGLSPWRPLTVETWNSWKAVLGFAAPLAELKAPSRNVRLPDGVSRWILGLKELDGQIEGRLDINRRPQSASPELARGTLRLSGAQIVHDALGLPLYIEDGEIKIESPDQTRFNATGRWGNSEFDAKGACDSWCRNFTTDLSAEARSSELLGLWNSGHRFPLQISDPLPARIKIAHNNSQWTYSGEFGFRKANWQGPNLGITSADSDNRLTFDIQHSPGSHVQVRQVQITINGSKLVFSGATTGTPAGGFSFNMRAEQVRLADWGIRLNKSGEPLKGVLSSELQGHLDLEDGSGVELSGRASVRGPRVQHDSLPYPIEGDLLSVWFEGRTMDFEIDNLVLNSNRAQASGRLTGWQGMRGNVNLLFETLELNDLLDDHDQTSAAPPSAGKEDGIADQSPASSGQFVQNSQITLKLHSQDSSWKGIGVGALVAACRIKSGNVYIDKLRLDSANGQLRLRGHIKTNPLPEQFYLGRIRASKQPVERIIRMLGLPPRGIEGEMALDGLFAVRGTRKDELLSKLTGGFNIDVGAGQVPDPNLALKILNFLSLQNIFIQKPPDIAEEGFFFESIKGHLTLNSGMAESEALILKSPVFNAVTRGKADLINRRLDAEIAVQPLGTLDWVVSKIPIIGHILTGDDNSVLVYYFKAEGPFDQADIRYVPFKNLAESTAGYFKRIIFTPDRILEGISSLPEELEKLGVPLEPGDLQVLEDMEGP